MLKVLYICHGNYNLLSRAKRQITSLRSYNYNVVVLNFTFGKVFEYNYSYPIINKVIKTTNSPLFNFIDLIYQNFKAIKYYDQNLDLIICRELSVLIAGILIKRRKKCKLIYDNNELSVEQYSGIKKVFWRIIERYCIRFCDAIIHANKLRRDYFVEKYKLLSTKNYVIENYSNYYQNEITNKTNNDKIKILFFGGLDYSRNIEDLVLAAKYNKNVSLDLIGFGTEIYLKKIKEMIGESKNIQILPPISDLEINNKFKEYKIGVAFYPNVQLNNWLCAPNKVWQYLQSGLAVITTANPTLKNIIESNNVGVCIERIDEKTISEAVNLIVKNKLWENITDEFKWVYSWQNIEKTYIKIIEEILCAE